MLANVYTWYIFILSIILSVFKVNNNWVDTLAINASYSTQWIIRWDYHTNYIVIIVASNDDIVTCVSTPRLSMMYIKLV